MKKLLIFIVSYNAEAFIGSVLDRIPDVVWDNESYQTEILIIDDQSPDKTFYRAIDHARRHNSQKITVLYNPQNQGYGGNQKLGYHYAIKNGFDMVVLLHGDGQYAPEYIPMMIQPLLDGEADAVFGSRMIKKSDALKGGMPLYKWVGNQILTFLQNRILRVRLSEFHTGYRAYGVKALESIPFQHNSDYFDFDTDIIIQLIDTQKRIKEIAIPTYYGEEISNVNGTRYALLILKTTFMSRLVPFGIFFDPRFDYVSDGTQYTPKFDFPSSHTFALARVKAGDKVLDLGSGPGFMAQALSEKGSEVISVDLHIHPQARQYSARTVETDLDTYDFEEDFGHVDVILMLDIIEHLRSPEAFLKRLRDSYAPVKPKIIITTGNIGFLVTRLGLLLGQFNYGKRGILDLDHTRLFTMGSLRRILIYQGYDILETQGIPAPYPLAIGDSFLSRFLLRINRILIFFSKGLFSYQVAAVAAPKPTLEQLLDVAYEAGKSMEEEYEG